jgi:hypothetical protein
MLAAAERPYEIRCRIPGRMKLVGFRGHADPPA